METPRKNIIAGMETPTPTPPITTPATQWVHLLPSGTAVGFDGRGPYKLDVPKIMAAWARRTGDLPIDYEHQSIGAMDKTGAIPAAGWIKDLQSRDNGIWGLVEWTSAAQQYLAQKEYRYVSPVFTHSTVDGTIFSLLGAGLTHTPNLMLTAVASQLPITTTQKGKLMDEQLEYMIRRLRDMFNLPTLTTPDEVFAEVAKLQSMVTTQTAAMSALQAQVDNPDPAKFVPIAMFTALQSQLATTNQKAAEDAVTTAVQSAITAGKIPPNESSKAWAANYAQRDPQGFSRYVATAPALVTPVGAPPVVTAAQSQAKMLSETEMAAAKAMGLTAEAFSQLKK